MQDEPSQPNTEPTVTDPQSARVSHASPNRTSPSQPSRDMLGGPWLGALLFLVIAVGLGWALMGLFQHQLDAASQNLQRAEFESGFDPDQVYTLRRGLLIGYLTDGRSTLFPGKADLPTDAPGRRTAPTLDAVRDEPSRFPEVVGVVEPGQAVRFVEAVIDTDNPQTRVLLMVEVLTGPLSSRRPVIGMHLETIEERQSTGEKRFVPRADLFAPAEPAPAPIQSTESDARPTDE